MNSDFPFELDHLVVFVSADAPEAKALEAAGLQGFGGNTAHGGLGTASTSFFFSNLLYLELFWVHDLTLARQKLEPLGLNIAARVNWRSSGALPFGLMLRRAQKDATDVFPFPTQAMPAEWMPPGTVVEFNGEATAEPYYGVVPESLSFRGFRANIPDLPHPLGVKHLTGVTLSSPNSEWSPIARALTEAGVVTFESGGGPLMTLAFDDGAQRNVIDLRPTLPLVFKA